jgi:hypothetical protein
VSRPESVVENAVGHTLSLLDPLGLVEGPVDSEIDVCKIADSKLFDGAIPVTVISARGVLRQSIRNLR